MASSQPRRASIISTTSSTAPRVRAKSKIIPFNASQSSQDARAAEWSFAVTGVPHCTYYGESVIVCYHTTEGKERYCPTHLPVVQKRLAESITATILDVVRLLGADAGRVYLRNTLAGGEIPPQYVESLTACLDQAIARKGLRSPLHDAHQRACGHEPTVGNPYGITAKLEIEPVRA